VRQFDIHGKKINYDAPGQMGAHTPKPQKLPMRPRFNVQLDALCDYYEGRGEKDRPLHVTMAQIRSVMHVPRDQVSYEPTGKEEYRGHLLFVLDDE
jgi:hypothetical protein